MSDRYKGAILSPTAPTVIPQSAGGVYTLSQQTQYQGQGVWPSAVNNPVNNSLRFRSSASAYLSRTPASASNRTTWTWSGWVKLGLLSPSSGWNCIFGAYSNDNNRTFFYTNNSSSNTFYIFDLSGGSTTCNLISTQVLRDVSAWYHLVVAVDTTQATSSNRIKVYLNGTQITAFGTATYPSQNTNFMVNNNVVHYIGASSFSGINLFHDGYMTEINFIDGTALTPSSFGTTDAYGIWQPIPYTGAYGTNGFYLPFTDNSALTTSSNVGLGKDFSGNGNYWVTNNISITAGVTYDSMTDVPTNTNSNTANYCTLNPLNASTTAAANNGNLQAYSTSGANTGAAGINGTIALPTTGKYYFEVTMSAVSNAGLAGIAKLGATQDTNFGAGAYANIYAYTNTTGVAYTNNTTAYTGSTLTTGDILGVAVDMTNGALYFAKNNTWQNSGNPLTGAGAIAFTVTADLLPTCYAWKNSGADALSANFGQRPFSYTPPSGFYPLNTYNLPTPTILAGNQYMDATTFTGNASTNVITNSGSMQPDMVWLKSRSNANNHTLYDALRGVNTLLYPNLTNAEAVGSAQLTSFNSNGFTLGASENANDDSGESSVGWQWRASNAAGVSNTQGTITSTVSANTTAGFSIVTYTGTGSNATVGHGLGVAPSMVIVKRRDAGSSPWNVWHTSLTSGTYFLVLNDTAAQASGATRFTALPTSTVINIGTDGDVNANTGTYVAYCFAQVAGYSAFGSYTGNGSTDGPFVFCGFRPRWVMVKNASTGGTGYNWLIYDTSRDTFNVADDVLRPNLSDAEVVYAALDITSNGFKIRNSGVVENQNGNTIIYAAFAENPFKIARAR